MTEPLAEPPAEEEGNDQEVHEGTETEIVKEGDLEDAPDPEEEEGGVA